MLFSLKMSHLSQAYYTTHERYATGLFQVMEYFLQYNQFTSNGSDLEMRLLFGMLTIIRPIYIHTIISNAFFL